MLIHTSARQLTGKAFLPRCSRTQELTDAIPLPDATPANTQDEVSDVALINAIRAQELAKVESLLSRGAETNIEDADGRTALMLGAVVGQAKIVQVLLEAGADANVQSTDGRTALMLAIQIGGSDISVVEALLAGGADVNMKAPDGSTVLLTAVMKGRTDIVRRILATGKVDLSG